MVGNFHYDRKKRYITTRKKRYSRLSDGCAVLAITTGKKRYSLCLVNERFIINELVTISMVFFGLGVMNDTAKSNCILTIGDDGSLNGGCSSSKLIIIEINTESEYQQPADWNGVINQVKNYGM